MYTKQDAIKQLQECFKQNNQHVTKRIYEKEKRKPSVSWIIRQFGSWKKALNEADVTNTKINLYTKDYMIKQIQECAKEHDNPSHVSKENYKKSNRKPCADYIANYFGGWLKALEVSLQQKQKEVRIYSEEDMLKGLKDCHNCLGTITKRLYIDYAKKNHLANETTVSNKFGSWNEALKKANLPIHTMKQNKYSKEQIKKVLQTYQESYKNQFTMEKYDQIRKPSDPAGTTIARQFGSWTKALEAAKIAYSRKHYTDEEMLKYLFSVMQNNQIKLTTYQYTKQSTNPSVTQYIKRFGSWKNALTKAKEYNEDFNKHQKK